jgi:hypothetical protein
MDEVALPQTKHTMYCDAYKLVPLATLGKIPKISQNFRVFIYKLLIAWSYYWLVAHKL